MKNAFILLILSVFIPSACLATPAAPKLTNKTHIIYTSHQPLKRPVIAKHIVKHFKQWRGVKYKLGGTSRSGIDCSSYMQHLFRDEFDIVLPRTTGEQLRQGKIISADKLHAGDLIFFVMKKGQHHVGVYAGNGKFIHASSSRGIMMSSLDNPFWTQHYQTSRRVITREHPAV